MAEASKLMVAAGATGLVGRYVVAAALAAGHRVRILSRGPSRPDGVDPRAEVVQWDPVVAAGSDPAAVDAVRRALDGADWIVNLAGSSIVEGRMNEARKTKILSSRLLAVAALRNGFVACERPPGFWFQGSAVGWYGDTGDAEVDEGAPAGDTFLADVCVAWEGATNPIAHPEAGAPRARLAIGRIGLVLAKDAPAWEKLLKPIRYGAGGRLGKGNQWWAWIEAEDVGRAILFLAEHGEAEGVFNITAPNPVQQVDLTRQIAKRMRRPSWIPAPAFMLRLVLGEMAELLLLASCKAMPKRLGELRFEFKRGTLDAALDYLLG